MHEETGVEMSEREPVFYPEHASDELGPRCGDGRVPESTPQEQKKELGFQMFGASTKPPLIRSIATHTPFDRESLAVDYQTLKDSGFGLGTHRGEHGHNPEENRSDCGAADNIVRIVQTMKDGEDEFRKEIKKIITSNRDSLKKARVASEYINEAIGLAFEKIRDFDINLIRITGEELVQFTIDHGASWDNLAGIHKEDRVHMNMAEDVTFDSVKANEGGNPAFNEDIPAITRQTTCLGVDEKTALGISLIHALAVRKVLKPDAPIYVNA